MSILRSRALTSFAVAFLFVAVGTFLISRSTNPDVDAIAAAFYLLLVVIFAERFGMVCAVFTATLTSLCFTYYFLLPIGAARIEVDELVPMGVFFTVGIWTAVLTSNVRLQKEQAQRRERETDGLYRLTLAVLSHPRLEESLSVLVESLGGGESCAFVRVDDEGELHLLAGRLALDDARRARVRLSLTTPDPLDDVAGEEKITYLPLRVDQRTLGVMVVRTPLRLGPPRSLLLAVASHGALALQRSALEQAAVEALGKLEAERLKASLLASVSHDLRTPLASIKAAATNIVLDDVQTDEATRATLLSSIVGNADRMDRLVGNLLSMSRLEAGAWKPVKELFPFSEIIAGTLGALSERDAARVRVDMPDDLPLVALDGLQIEQVLLNLLENALKYVPGGSPLELTVRHRAGSVEVQIRDHGPGIPEGEERLIFQKFYRAHRGGERGAPGVGMGLAICREMVEAHGGEIRASNAPDGGAVFTFVLPLDDKEPAPHVD